MWGTILLINSTLLALTSLYFVYSIGAAILLFEWKQMLVMLLLCIFFGFVQIALGALAEP